MIPWWLLPAWDLSWSKEETRVMQAIHLVAVVIFVTLVLATLWLVQSSQTSDSTLELVIVFAYVLVAWYAGRQIIALLWPKLVATADKNAAKRLDEMQRKSG